MKIYTNADYNMAVNENGIEKEDQGYLFLIHMIFILLWLKDWNDLSITLVGKINLLWKEMLQLVYLLFKDRQHVKVM